MSRNVTVTYKLNPPSSTPSTQLESTRTLSVPVPEAGSGEGESGKFYNALRSAIARVKDTVGEDLTAWRDAVGSLEQSKEPNKLMKADEEDEEEEDDESEE